LFAQNLPWWISSTRFLLLWRYFPRTKSLNYAVAIRLALQDLGPLFVKFGQILSTRRDLLPIELAQQLAMLQDKVPPFDAKQSQQIIEQYLNAPLDTYFCDFTLEPLASASVAQVHAARLISGEDVIIKVVRPGLRQVIDADIAWLLLFAKITEKLIKRTRKLNLVNVVTDYQKTILDELDLIREAGNASQLKRNCANSHLISNMIYVPKVYWDLCRPQLLVMERIYGLTVTDVASLKKAGINLKLLAARGVEVFFTQVFYDNFFHADMHPGNIFVNPKKPDDPQYIAVDFGIMGSLTPEDKDYIARNLLAFFKRDYRKVARLHIDSGWVASDINVIDFEADIRSACEPVFARPLKDISFASLLLRLFKIAQRFNMEVQSQLVLLQKTLLNIEGLGRQLYPDLNLWDTAAPFLETWLKQRYCPKQVITELRTQIEHIPHLASRGKKIITTLENMQNKKATTSNKLLGLAVLAISLTCLLFDLKLEAEHLILMVIGIYLLNK